MNKMFDILFLMPKMLFRFRSCSGSEIKRSYKVFYHIKIYFDRQITIKKCLFFSSARKIAFQEIKLGANAVEITGNGVFKRIGGKKCL